MLRLISFLHLCEAIVAPLHLQPSHYLGYCLIGSTPFLVSSCFLHLQFCRSSSFLIAIIALLSHYSCESHICTLQSCTCPCSAHLHCIVLFLLLFLIQYLLISSLSKNPVSVLESETLFLVSCFVVFFSRFVPPILTHIDLGFGICW